MPASAAAIAAAHNPGWNLRPLASIHLICSQRKRSIKHRNAGARLEDLGAAALVGAACVAECRGPVLVDEALGFAILSVRREPLVVDAHFDSQSRFPGDDILVRISGKITIEEVIDIRRDAPG